MGRFNLSFVVFMAMMVATMQFRGSMAQTRHVVGDTLGWTIPPGGEIAYTTWAALQTFTVGDMLVFNFTNGQHDVAEVSESAYGPCTATNPISLATTGPVTISLTTPGTHYYICTFTSHCQIGQKLTINVSAAATATPPSTTPITPSSSPTIAPSPPMATPPMATPPMATPPMATPPMATPPMATPPTTMASPPSPPTSSPNTMPPSTPPSSSSPSPIGSSTPPPPNNGATSFTAMGFATFLTVALAFLNY